MFGATAGINWNDFSVLSNAGINWNDHECDEPEQELIGMILGSLSNDRHQLE